MKICKKCLCVTDENSKDKCPECGGAEFKDAEDGEFVFLAQVDSFTMPIFTGLLDKRGIEHKGELEVFSNDVELGGQNGESEPMFARYSVVTQKVYVKFSDYTAARDVLKIITGMG